MSNEGSYTAGLQNQRRCLHCNTEGHIIRHCPELLSKKFKGPQGEKSAYKRQADTKKKVTTSNNSPPGKTSPDQKALQFTYNNKNSEMEVPRDWLTMPLNAPADVWERRPNVLNVYIAPREELNPANQFLL